MIIRQFIWHIYQFFSGLQRGQWEKSSIKVEIRAQRDVIYLGDSLESRAVVMSLWLWKLSELIWAFVDS